MGNGEVIAVEGDKLVLMELTNQRLITREAVTGQTMPHQKLVEESVCKGMLI